MSHQTAPRIDGQQGAPDGTPPQAATTFGDSDDHGEPEVGSECLHLTVFGPTDLDRGIQIVGVAAFLVGMVEQSSLRA